ncbi:unnamed protein product [Allacma fusca]|uniref:Lipocalin/cytosolic fatty-acid binding domain-containing protein n=1 Tax=Allacma fusca TaxID=39272 RepID=A0A8J2NSK7_9HEXA|nr:unnamed protein product [Allacma fusca]
MSIRISMSLLKFLTLSSCVTLGFSDDTYFKSCPKLRGMRSFNISEAKGKWYEVGRFGALPEYAGTCVHIDFQETNAVDSFSTHVYHQHLGGWSKWHTIGTSKFRYPEKTADFKLVVDMRLLSSIPLEYSILEMDYKNVGIIWTCLEKSPGIHNEGLWIIARTPQPSSEDSNKVRMKLRTLGLDPQQLKEIVNNNC